MAKRQRRNDEEEGSHEIRLPESLLEQIKTKEDKGDYEEDESRYMKFTDNSKKKKEKPVSRKERRQQERQLKKQKRSKPSKPNQPKKSAPAAKNSSKDKQVSEEKDPLAALKALKEKKMQQQQKTQQASKDTTEDPLELLRKLKQSKNGGKETEVRIVKADELSEDEEFSGDDDAEDFEEEDFEDFDLDEDDDEADAESDPLEALRKLKENKSKGNGKTTEIRVINEDELSDDEISDNSNDSQEEIDQGDEENGDFPGFDDDDEDQNLGFDDDAVDDDDFDSIQEDEDDYEEDPLAKLKALKEAKKNNSSKEPKAKKSPKESPRIISKHDQEMMRKDEEDMAFYAKQLGLKNGKRAKLSKIDDDDLVGGLLDGLDLDFGSESAAEESMDEQEEEEDDFDLEEEDMDSDDSDARIEKENPYVAPTQSRDTAENVSSEPATTSYIPPALRRKLALEGNGVSEDILNLRKSIKGPLNRLSEANVGNIVNDINALFMSNPRHSVNTELTSIVLDSIIQQGRLLDTFVYLHATLVVAIYRLQGVEFGAHFIQSLIEKFETFQKEASKGKEASNIVSLLSSVYLFQLVSSKLLYDIIKVLINQLNESNADLLLRIIRNSGNQMRSDDPTALKEIVLLINEVKSTLSSKTMSTRTQFLVEAITSLKNNKMKINNEGNHQLSIRLKKFLATINNNKFNDPIQVSLDDIHSIESRGKWWLVGSAWKGHAETKDEVNVNEDAMNDILDNSEPNWMELARAQRMNTDIRRAIFISIMSANDYIDALTKLDKLALKRSQDREIPRVLIHCTGVEPAWNPYYGILAKKLCENHKYRKTLQFMLWDLVKEFEGSSGDDEEDFIGFDHSEDDEETKLKRILNLGRFFGYLFAEGSLPLHLLRTINFLTATSDTTLFMEVVFVSFLDIIGKKSQINSVGAGLSKKSKDMYEQKFDDRKLIETVIKAQEQPTLLRGIQFFLQDKVRSSGIVSGKKQKRRIEWGVTAMVDIIDEFLRSNDKE
ncbi:uncharacterized protein RJT20DRAFT_124062 [Scheffersomyces xylosifermentans]|uniref:uncharacterized protein n=1 Tax=Scheffersomyces xylosifermentans TaxID=1304137 RepID=UPI00315D1314